MKYLFTVLCLFAAAFLISAQDRPWARKPSPKSPAVMAKGDFGGKIVSIDYSAPSLRGRPMLDIMKSDGTMPVWRAGAQDATLLHTDGDLDLGGLSVPKGEYTLFINLADTAKWQLIVNKQIHQWGLTYNKDQDLGRVNLTMAKPAASVEVLRWEVANMGAGKGKITLEWGDYSASVPMTVK